MKKNTVQKTDTLTSTIKIVDSKLILSLPTAQMPVVWQMDLDKAQSAAFTIKENKGDKNFSLVLKTQDGKMDDIASFDDKESALEILMETSSVLQNAHGQIKPVAAASNTNVAAADQAASSKDGGSDKLGAFLAVTLVIVLVLIWSVSSSVPSKMSGSSALESMAASAEPRQSSGVPVSAEDFLNNR
tara:strand:+ start:32015 stop:32575 length:561 start_codon:yes stop_codon:yes gene_type:complete